MKIAKGILALGSLVLAASPAKANKNDFLQRLKHPFSSSSEASSSSSSEYPAKTNNDILDDRIKHPFYSSGKANLTHLSSLPEEPPPKFQDELNVVDLIEQQNESIEDARQVNLRHRLLTAAGEVKKAMSSDKTCVDRSLSSNDLYFHTCHGGWNQKHRYDPNNGRIYVGDRCWDDAMNSERNVYAAGCHNGNNQKWYIDSLGRIRGKHDNRCVDTVGSSLKMRPCSDALSQKFIFPRDFPWPNKDSGNAALIKPFYDQKLCWDIGGELKNLYLYSCHGKFNQQFYYYKPRELIYVGSGSGCMDEDSKGNVYAHHNCHGGNNQRWFFDAEGRIRNRKDDSKCLESDANDNNNLRVVQCSDSDRQRFVFPKEYPTRQSHVVNLRESKCWDASLSTKNLFLHTCHEGKNQDFFYSPQSERIMDASGFGCVDANPTSADVILHPCHGGNNQKWYRDNQGRIRNRNWSQDENKCLTTDRNDKNNLEIGTCSSSIDQTFFFPLSFETKINAVKPYFDQDLCMDVDQGKDNVNVWECHGGPNQNAYYISATGQILMYDSGAAKCVDGTGDNVRVTPCNGGAGMSWSLDEKGRLQNKHRSGKCLAVSPSDNRNLVMADCGGNDAQRFILPDGFPHRASVVKTFDGTLCWDMNTDYGKNLRLSGCNDKPNQFFLFIPESERIINPSGLCMDDYARDERNVYFYKCHDGNNQKWFIDDRGRIHSRHDGKCLDSNDADRNLFIAECNNEESQRFIYPKSFATVSSPVTPYAEPTKCWDMDPESKNLDLRDCDGQANQDFFYIPESKQIIVASGEGCLDDHMSDRNVYVHGCHDGNNQQWYLDAQGRVHSKHDDSCLAVDKSNNNIRMEDCDEGLNQRFAFPNSFPVVTTNAETAFKKRQELNSYYSETSRHVYGEKTRSILRYHHPDQIRRNLCPYWESGFVFDYTMQNYKLSSSSVIDVKATSDMELLLDDDSRQFNAYIKKRLRILRPKQGDGYFRLGDFATNKDDGVYSALVVKAEANVLKPPDDYVLVWNGTSTASATSGGSFWKPEAPPGYACLGHVWSDQKPKLDLIRCIQEKFVETSASTWIWDNNDEASSAEEDGSVWETGSTTNSMTPGTFVSKASNSAPASEQFTALKKSCIRGQGRFPFCGGNADNLKLDVEHAKEFSVPYAKLKQCYYSDEDQETYGLVNEADSRWKNHAFELLKYSSDSVGYKHVGASEHLGAAYCLGSVVFGSSEIKKDMFVHNVTEIGEVSKGYADRLRKGKVGASLSQLIDGDFVFLFPCSDTSEVKEYGNTLQGLASEANKDGSSENAVANGGENLGEVMKYGSSKWANPHYCGKSEEPTKSGECRMVDFCFFEPGGCKPYDQLPCKEDSDCKGGYCSTIDGLCGKNVRLHTDESSTVVDLPRAVSYGIGQDGPGRFLARVEGSQVQLSGNVWKAFKINSHTISYNTVLEFDFRLVNEAEGHAICLDEDLNEDVEIQGAKRCFRLAGTQEDVWSEVWKVEGPGTSGEFKHYEIRVGSIAGNDGPGGDQPYISWGAHIEYLALVQDNDADENMGLSVFRNLKLYDDEKIDKQTIDPGPKITGESITIDVDNTQNKNGKWKVECTRLDGSVPDQPPQSVYKWDKTVFTSSSADTYPKKLDSLLPGYEYTTKIYPIDGNGNQKSGSDIQTTIASTYCCCDCDSKIVGDTSGRPFGMNAYQEEGYVMFVFNDNSRCAEAYAFTRSDLEDEFFDNSDETRKSVFTPNYNYYPKKKCGKAPVIPGKAASDDLRVSKLVVGSAYRYCVRAVANFYSADSEHSSDENCNIHWVRWQASMVGKITTEPMAGSLPIEDVSVSWELMNPDQTLVIASGSAGTKRPGKFSIEFDELHKSLDRDSEFPVRIRFEKTTVVGGDTIKHQFLCHEGSMDCTDDGTIVYLKHLTFDEPIVTYDNSSIPVRGRVNIWEPDGCPVIGAEVCLKIKHTRSDDTTGACVKTDHNGDYNVPATIGSTVGIEVSYHNHTISKAPENSMDYDKGGFINVNKRYERNDFVDESKATLVVEVAGGLCNKTLGTSSLELTVNGCDADHWKMDLTQQFFKGEHWVPAHVLQVKVRGMSDGENKGIDEETTDYSKLMEYFYGETMTIDLLDAGEMEEETEDAVESNDNANEEVQEEATEAEEQVDKVRFQYDGDLQLDFRFLGADMAGDCTMETITPQGTIITDQQTTNSLHVTPTGSSFRPKVFMRYELLPDLTCDILDDGMVVRVVNKVGIDNDFYEDYAPTLKDKGALLEHLTLCSDDDGCEYPVEHDMLNGEKANANMMPKSDDGRVLSFSAGRPNIFGDYRKDLMVEVLGKDRTIIKRHKAEVVVVGDYVKGPGASFALPTYKPILILRDPPGGLSQATYENVQTTMKVKSSEVETLMDTEYGFAKSFGAELGLEMCAGFGAMACKDVVSVQGKTTLGFELSGSKLLYKGEDSYESEFTTTWSYATSDDPLLAGRNSDVIVIPNLNVQYHEVETVAFYPTCVVNTTEVVKFSLTDPGNKPTLSFLSVYDIEEHQIPGLESAVDSKQAEYDKLEDGDSNKDKVKDQLKTLQDALIGWNQTMEAYDKTNELAGSNGLDIAGREWFSKWASKKDLMDDEPKITDHWSNFAPETLTERAQAFDFDYIKKANLASSDKEDLKQTNRIQFSGGGGAMEYVLHHAGANELLRLDPGALNADLSIGGLWGTGIEVESAASSGLEIERKFSLSTSSSSTITDGGGLETAISFALGDEQENDEFVVDIYVDPTYGTFVFHTVSGRSSAPHEENTLKGENLRVAMERPTSPVMPDEPIVFHITFGNNGVMDALVAAAVDQTSNPLGLRHAFGGQRGGVDYFLGAESEVTTLLEITRGPRDYVFPATTLEFGATWDEEGNEAVTVELWNFDDENGKWIKFEEPCPVVEWAGALKREKKASVIKEIEPVRLTVFNPRHASGTFETMAQTGRLNNVFVFYRELGDSEWKKAQLEDHTDIDFANIPKKAWKESVYGYANIPWNIGQLLALTADGTYEVMVKSFCTELSTAPDEFNAFSTEPIILVVDRVQPELYGKALPVKDIVVPGQEVAMVFTESIRCSLPYRFELEVRVAGLEDKFDERNLKIDCKNRKLGFQFDPVRIKYDLLMGKEMTVTIDSVQDLEGNVIPNKITFTKTIANLNLDDVTTSFDFILNTESCSAPMDEAGIRDKVASELALSDPNRVSVIKASCDGKDTVAKIQIGASAAGGTGQAQRQLRNNHHDVPEENDDDPTALSAFYDLMDKATSTEEDENGGAPRKLISLTADDHTEAEGVPFYVSNLEIFPGEADVREYELDAEPTREEEMIMAAAEGCDIRDLEHREHMMRMEQSVKEHLNATESHMDQKAKETASHIDELELHLEMLDHKLDSKLDVGEQHISKLESSVQDLSQEMDSHIHELDHKLDEIVSRLMLEDKHKPAKRLEVENTGGEEEKQQHHHHHHHHSEEEASASSEMADLLYQMRREQKQARIWNMLFGLCAMVAMVASLYGRTGR